MNLYLPALIIGMECATCLVHAEQKEVPNTSVRFVNSNQATANNHVQELESKAMQGDSIAQCTLAVCYGKGDGVPKNYDKAFYWATKAEQQKNPQAYPILFTCYARGLGCPQDNQKALEYLKKGAEADIAFCQANLALYLYYGGLGVSLDPRQAVELAQKVVREDDHNKTANGLLGDAYLTGNGVGKDVPKGLAYLRQGASSGSSSAQYTLSRLLRSGSHGVTKDIPQGLQWLQKSATAGNGNAQYELAVLLIYGKDGLKQDITQGIQWLQKSAELGHAEAQNNLGLLYLKGEEVERNERKAFQWIHASAMQHEALAQYNLGGLYMGGLGVEKIISRQQHGTSQVRNKATRILWSCWDNCILPGGRDLNKIVRKP